MSPNIGDVYSGIGTVASGEFLDIRPSFGIEVSIHNLYHESNVELYWTDGTNSFKFDSDTGFGVYAFFVFHVTNSIYIKVKNVSGSTQTLGYDGIITSV